MQHTNNNNDRLTQAVSSDYYRRRNQRRLAYDICIFFLVGVLFLLLAEFFIGG